MDTHTETVVFGAHPTLAGDDGAGIHYVRPARDGAPSYSNLEKLLGSDVYGAIRVIYADGSMIANVQAIVERCWHDAQVRVANAQLADRAA